MKLSVFYEHQWNYKTIQVEQALKSESTVQPFCSSMRLHNSAHTGSHNRESILGSSVSRKW